MGETAHRYAEGLIQGGKSGVLGTSIGMGYLRLDLTAVKTRLKLRIFNQLWDIQTVEDSPYDPTAAIRKEG